MTSRKFRSWLRWHLQTSCVTRGLMNPELRKRSFFGAAEMGSSAGVFCHNGLGDGVVGLVLSNNLHLNGFRVDTYQDVIGSMQNWFPHLPVMPYPSVEMVEKLFHAYDFFFVFQNDTSDLIQKLIYEGKRRFPDRVKVIYIYPSRRIINEPYYQDARIDPNASVPENLRRFCEKILHLPKSTRSNGFIAPPELKHRLYQKRVIIHPTSSRPGKNWCREKYVQVALKLREEGYDPVWILGPHEKDAWGNIKGMGFLCPEFPSLDGLSRFIYESGYLLGNDSGLGHLASFLGVPTLTLTRRRTLAKLWAPSYAPGIVVTPHPLIPNIRGLRLRDRYWQKFISIAKVLKAFNKLVVLH